MSPTRSTLSSPWPAQTDAPTHVGKRKRIPLDTRSRPPLLSRDGIANQTQIGISLEHPIEPQRTPLLIPFVKLFFHNLDEAKQECSNTDNSVLSCWPTSDTKLTQGDNTQFVCTSTLLSVVLLPLLNATIQGIASTHRSLSSTWSTLLCIELTPENK